jgi:hypothetical protein
LRKQIDKEASMNSGKWNVRGLLLAGLAAGAVQSAAGVLMYLAGVYFEPWSMAVSAAVLLACIVAGVGWYRGRYAGDGFSYLDALVVGAVVSLGTGVVYAVYNLISINFLYPNFLDEVARTHLATMTAAGAPAQSLESVRSGVGALPIAVGNLIRLTVFGIVLSAVVALFMKDRGRATATAEA